LSGLPSGYSRPTMVEMFGLKKPLPNTISSRASQNHTVGAVVCVAPTAPPSEVEATSTAVPTWRAPGRTPTPM